MIEVLKNPKFKNVLQNSGLKPLRGLGQMRKGNNIKICLNAHG